MSRQLDPRRALSARRPRILRGGRPRDDARGLTEGEGNDKGGWVSGDKLGGDFLERRSVRAPQWAVSPEERRQPFVPAKAGTQGRHPEAYEVKTASASRRDAKRPNSR